MAAVTVNLLRVMISSDAGVSTVVWAKLAVVMNADRETSSRVGDGFMVVETNGVPQRGAALRVARNSRPNGPETTLGRCVTSHGDARSWGKRGPTERRETTRLPQQGRAQAPPAAQRRRSQKRRMMPPEIAQQARK